LPSLLSTPFSRDGRDLTLQAFGVYLTKLIDGGNSSFNKGDLAPLKPANFGESIANICSQIKQNVYNKVFLTFENMVTEEAIISGTIADLNAILHIHMSAANACLVAFERDANGFMNWPAYNEQKQLLINDMKIFLRHHRKFFFENRFSIAKTSILNFLRNIPDEFNSNRAVRDFLENTSQSIASIRLNHAKENTLNLINQLELNTNNLLAANANNNIFYTKAATFRDVEEVFRLEEVPAVTQWFNAEYEHVKIAKKVVRKCLGHNEEIFCAAENSKEKNRNTRKTLHEQVQNGILQDGWKVEKPENVPCPCPHPPPASREVGRDLATETMIKILAPWTVANYDISFIPVYDNWLQNNIKIKTCYTHTYNQQTCDNWSSLTIPATTQKRVIKEAGYREVTPASVRRVLLEEAHRVEDTPEQTVEYNIQDFVLNMTELKNNAAAYYDE
jgi:hypothetical protein